LACTKDETVSPDDRVVARSRKLNREANLSSARVETSRKAVFDIKCMTDVLGVCAAVAKPEGRTACNHQYPSESGQVGDELVCQRIRHDRKRTRSAKRNERQNRDGGLSAFGKPFSPLFGLWED